MKAIAAPRGMGREMYRPPTVNLPTSWSLLHIIYSEMNALHCPPPVS